MRAGYHSCSQKMTRRGECQRAGGITTYQTWLYYYDSETKQQSSMWTVRGSAPPKKVRVRKSAGKHMCIMFMDQKGILLKHFVPDGQTVNSSYYSKVCLVICFCSNLTCFIESHSPTILANRCQILVSAQYSIQLLFVLRKPLVIGQFSFFFSAFHWSPSISKLHMTGALHQDYGIIQGFINHHQSSNLGLQYPSSRLQHHTRFANES